jgi:hypothetical protein
MYINTVKPSLYITDALGAKKTVCYTEVPTIQRLFHIRKAIYLDKQKQSVMERFSLHWEV